MLNLMNKRAVAALVTVGLGVGGTVMWATQAGASGAVVTQAAGATQTPPPRPHDIAQPAVTPAIAATNATCGETITASLTLNGDLFCSTGVAITIGAKSVTLNLNGHVIGDPSGTADVGVLMLFPSDVVEKGAVIGFVGGVGVEVTGAGSTVTLIKALNDNYGIADYGTKDKITSNVMSADLYGLVAEGPGSTYSGDHELNNSIDGIFVQSPGGLVTGNVANGNGGNGINDDTSSSGIDTSATLTKNTANYNSQAGIDTSGDSAVTDGGGNLAKGNTTTVQCIRIVCS
jgi:hypothetical protein